MHAPFALAVFAAGIFAAGALAEGPVADREWRTLYDAGLAASRRHNDEEALGLLERSWKIADTSGERGVSAVALGQVDRRLGRFDEAKEWLERARGVFESDPSQAPRLAATVSDLADLYRTTGDYRAAESLLRAMLAPPSSASGDAESKALLRNNLADLLREEGRSAEAHPLFEQSLDGGPVSWQQRAGALIGLADIAREQGAWQAGIDRWNEALDICRRDGDERAEAIVLLGLGGTWLKSGSAARAEPLLRRALRIMESNPDMPPEEVATAHSGLAELYRGENKLALAEDEWSRALRIDRTALGEAHPQVAVLMEMLSDVYAERGEFGMALDYAMKASRTMSASFGENSMPAATALTNRASVEARAGDFDAAAKDYRRAIRIAGSDPEHRPLREVMIRRYAGLLKAMHRTREAKALLSLRDTDGERPFQPSAPQP